MPPRRGAAAFNPISPDLDLTSLVQQTPNFKYAERIHCEKIDLLGLEAFEKLVLHHVILGGKPLVIEGYESKLSPWTFSTGWLRDNVGKKVEQARSLEKCEYLPITINHYLDNLPLLAHQWNRYNYKEDNRQRLYLKDIDCPPLWAENLKAVIPPNVFYLNESTGETDGPRSMYERHSNPATRKDRGIARAGDLMSSLPLPMRAENLMCYIGHEGTYTPCHREMCASLGQNIMVETSESIGEDGKPAKPGSSIWFMTESKDRHLVSEYWLSSLGHDIEVEAHFAQINAWKNAPFTTYIVEQKVGDLILIPPLAPHQVWNRGTRTVKVAWNRTTVETLDLALHEALPRARMVCRDEQYKNKTIILFSLNKYSSLLRRLDQQSDPKSNEQTIDDASRGSKVKHLRKDFKRLFNLYHAILLSESFSTRLLRRKVEYIQYDGFVTCSYCRCNIFNRFLTCKACLEVTADGEDTYDICLECYAMGRSCQCLSKLTWVEQFPWKDLVEKHEIWREQIVHVHGRIDPRTPLPLDQAQELLDKKTLAQICQEQLSVRPFQDPKKPDNDKVDEGMESDGVNDDGTLKKKSKKRRSEKWLKEHVSCHLCMHREVQWKLAVCQCGTAYCYGSLWRAFDLMPQTVMEDLNWRCPKCRNICNCATCKRHPNNHPYEPRGTVLGHDTTKFADPRSVESLVDFSYSNAHWLKKAGDEHPTESKRIEKRKAEAAFAKSQTASEQHDDDDNVTLASDSDTIPIDPRLTGDVGNPVQIRQASMALRAMNGQSQVDQDSLHRLPKIGIFKVESK